MKTSAQMFLGSSAAIVVACSAFVAPITTKVVPSTSSSLRMLTGSEYTASLPGTPFPDGKVFDPLGLSDGADPGEIKRWREAEIKHGRVAMLASLGVLVAEVRTYDAQSKLRLSWNLPHISRVLKFLRVQYAPMPFRS